MRERDKVSDSGDRSRAAKRAMTRSSTVGPGRNDGWVNGWGKVRLTITRPHCELHQSLLITLCSNFAHSRRHSKEVRVAL
jgi:hypothetical protein